MAPVCAWNLYAFSSGQGEVRNKRKTSASGEARIDKEATDDPIHRKLAENELVLSKRYPRPFPNIMPTSVWLHVSVQVFLLSWYCVPFGVVVNKSWSSCLASLSCEAGWELLVFVVVVLGRLVLAVVGFSLFVARDKEQVRPL